MSANPDPNATRTCKQIPAQNKSAEAVAAANDAVATAAAGLTGAAVGKRGGPFVPVAVSRASAAMINGCSDNAAAATSSGTGTLHASEANVFAAAQQQLTVPGQMPAFPLSAPVVPQPASLPATPSGLQPGALSVPQQLLMSYGMIPLESPAFGRAQAPVPLQTPHQSRLAAPTHTLTADALTGRPGTNQWVMSPSTVRPQQLRHQTALSPLQPPAVDAHSPLNGPAALHIASYGSIGVSFVQTPPQQALLPPPDDLVQVRGIPEWSPWLSSLMPHDLGDVAISPSCDLLGLGSLDIPYSSAL